MIPVTRKKWTPRHQLLGLQEQEITESARLICESHGLDPLVARLLVLRGHNSPEMAQMFLKGGLAQLPEPWRLKGMKLAVERIVAEIQAGGAPLISADYDSDGITSCAMLSGFFTAIGVTSFKFVPIRAVDGYGLSASAFRRAAEVGIKLVITVDCGISAVTEAALAKELGLDLIITDHHQPPEVLPEAYAIVNPHQDGCSFPFKDLSGAGVAFFLLIALRKALRDAGFFNQDRPEPDLRQYLDLACIAAVADIVPLRGPNRILTKAGLRLIQSGARPGIQALKGVAGMTRISSGTVAFGIAPRLNAAGRLKDAALGVDLLLELDPDRALEMAQDIDTMNRERREIEQTTVTRVVEIIELGMLVGKRSIVVAAEDIHAGVAGIVASRIVELYHLPTIIISLNEKGGKGSGRSIKGFHLYKAFDACKEHLLGFGGHEYAAGLSIARENVEAFALAFNQVAMKTLTEEDLIPTLAYDMEIPLADLTLQRIEDLEIMEPFGAGNPGPVFVVRGLEVKTVKAVGEGKHLSFTVVHGGQKVKCIAFGQGEAAEGLENRKIDILFKPGINEWLGNRSVQAEVQDFRMVG